MIVLLIVTFFIGWLVGAKQEQKRITKYGTIGSKPKIPHCVGHELESQKENEKMDKTKIVKGKIKELKK